MTGLGFVGIHTKINLTFTPAYVWTSGFMQSPFVFRFIKLLSGVTARSLGLCFLYFKVTHFSLCFLTTFHFQPGVMQCQCWSHTLLSLLISFTHFNAQFLYSLTICMLHYNPRNVSSINMPIFRRTNCIITASGIVTLCKRLYSMPDESRLQSFTPPLSFL